MIYIMYLKGKHTLTVLWHQLVSPQNPPPNPPKGGLKNLNVNALLGYKLQPKTEYDVLIWMKVNVVYS